VGSVRTSILRRPRRLSPHRRADHGEVRSYTLDWEEPDIQATAHGLVSSVSVPPIDTYNVLQADTSSQETLVSWLRSETASRHTHS